MGIKTTSIVAFALIAAANVARAGQTSCEGRWANSRYWPSAAYAVVNSELRYHLGPNWVAVGIGSNDAVQTEAGTLSFEGVWGTAPFWFLEGTFTVRWEITVYAGLDHRPTLQELQSWPAGSTYRFGYTGARFVCNGRGEAHAFSEPGLHSFEPPAGCTRMDVKLWGAGGGGHPDPNRFAWGGGAGFTSASITVPPAHSLYIAVGEGGLYHNDYHITGGGPTTLILPTYDGIHVLAQAGGGGAGGVYQGAGGGAGGGEISGFGGDGGPGYAGGANNSEDHGGRNWDGTFNGGYELFSYASSTSAGGGHWQGGIGFAIPLYGPFSPGGGGTGWVLGPGVSTSQFGQGTFGGQRNVPAGIGDVDYNGYAGYGAHTGGGGRHGLAVIYCRG